MIGADVLKVEGLGCERGGRVLFAGLGFVVPAGGALQIEGRNGAGKSSLLAQLAGLLPVRAGRIDHAGRIAYAGHDLALKPGMRLRDELAYWAGLDAQPAAHIDAALAAFDLTALGDLPVAVLSSGQKRRAVLARTAASGAALWLLDEPGVGLDSASLALLAAAMAAQRARGGAVVVATHADIGLTAPATLRLG